MFEKWKNGRDAEKKFVALTSIVAAIFLTVAKLSVGLYSGSLGILAEAAHSGMDLGAAVITFWAVRTAARPPDSHHQFGHEKFENLSALFETLLLVLTCFWIGYEAIDKLMIGEIYISHSPLTYGVMLVSIAVDFGRSRALMHTAKKYNSQALEADALHFRTDILSSSVVIFGLIGAHLGFPQADPIAALGVSLFVLWTSIQLGKACVDALMDSAPGDIQSKILSILDSSGEKMQYKNLRVRGAGAKSFINLDLDIDRRLTFEDAHKLVHRVQQEIEAAIPDSDVVIHADPFQSDREKIVDTLTIKSQQLGIAIHHIIITSLADGFVVEFHMECQPYMTLTAAYQISNLLKTQIYQALPKVKDINVHLEELSHDFREASDITESMDDERSTVQKVAQAVDGVINCHDVVFLKFSDDSVNVSLDCVLEGATAVFGVHQITSRVENAIRKEFPQLIKIIVHAEPLDGKFFKE